MTYLIDLEGFQDSVVNWTAVTAVVFGALFLLFRIGKAVRNVAVGYLQAWGEAHLRKARLAEPPPHAYKTDRQAATDMARVAERHRNKTSQSNKWLLRLGVPIVDDMKGVPIHDWGDPPEDSEDAPGNSSLFQGKEGQRR